MEDIIDIIVTETTNLIEITSQPTDEIIDVNIIDNREDITLNVTPSVVEININSLTGNFGVNWGDIEGTLSNQTDLQAVLNAKADLVDGKVPSSQLPSYVDDVVEVANYASLPITGEVGKIYITLDTNFIYRWSGSTYIEIKDSSAVWGAITGTLSSQTDLQSALNAKVPYTGATANVNLGEYGATVGYLGFDTTPTSTPTGIGTTYWDSFYRTLSLIDGDGDTTLQIGQEERVLVHNNTGSTLTDGQVVYLTGSTGELPSVALASNAAESTSSVTFGIVTESIANGADGFITTSGIIHGLNTLGLTEGGAIWLGSTAGTFTQTKPVAPANSVLVGYVIKVAGGNGSIFVKIINGSELDELHDVLITSKANNDGLFYESSSGLWKNKSIATVLGYTPANGANYLPLTGGTLTGNLLGTNITISNSLIAKGGTFNGGASAGVLTIDGLGSDFLMNRSNTSNGASITLLTDAVEKWNIGLRSAGTTDNFFIYNSNLTANALTINSATSAATFTSSVTATNFILSGGTGNTGLYFGHTDRVVLANYGVGGIDFETNGGGINMTLFPSGNLGVGVSMTDAGYKLDIAGTGRFSGALSGTSATFSGTLSTSAGYGILSGGGSFPIGASSTRGAIAINGSTDQFLTFSTQSYIYNSSSLFRMLSTSDIDFVSGGSQRMIIKSDTGNVGIGTTAPSHKLQVAGSSGTIMSLSNGADADLLMNFTSGVTLLTPTTGILAFGTSSTERMRITSDGRLLVSTTVTNPGQNNTDTGNALVGGRFFFNNGGSDNIIGRNSDGTLISWRRAGVEVGTIGVTSSATSYNTSSDYRLKQDLKSFDGLNLVNQIKAYDYQWKSDNTRSFGVLAHELAEVLPYAVQGVKDGERMQAVDYSKIVPVMVQAIQETDSKVVQLEKKIVILEAEIQTLKNK